MANDKVRAGRLRAAVLHTVIGECISFRGNPVSESNDTRLGSSELGHTLAELAYSL